MRTFSIEGGNRSPQVVIDENRNLVEISGNSTLLETNWFYGNLLKWIIAFNLGQNQTKTVNIRLRRLNKSSSKWIILIFNQVRNIFPGSNLEINWYFETNNQNSANFGQYLKNQSRNKVNIFMN